MRKFALVLIAVALVGLILFVALRPGAAPEIAIEPAAQAIGRNTPVKVRVSEPKRGVSSFKVELVQSGLMQTLAEPGYQPAPAWAFWRKGTTSAEVTVGAGRDAMKELKPGTAVVRVTAQRARALLWSPAPVVAQVELPVRLIPPSLQVSSIFTYPNQGGSEAVVYRVGESTVRDGVVVGPRFFPGYSLPGGSPQDRFALFAIAYDMSDPSGVRLVAEDAIGNQTQVKFIDKFFPKPLRHDVIQLNDAFMEKVTTQIMSQTPELSDKGKLLDNYLQINRDLRKKNDVFIQGLTAKTQTAFLWREPFLPMLNTAIRSNFAERRVYLYNGVQADEQDHLGLDMASVRAAPVPASNDGVVIFAGYLGIYGNCIVIDHGYGLSSLYGHLSSIGVKEGDKITRGQELGRSGDTGLAGGDHVHFAILLRGLPVSPIEWFDQKWINDRLKLKLGAALPFQK
jgi:murein DD-endopeptidase MepM/ murein hydrolase activator NlpD